MKHRILSSTVIAASKVYMSVYLSFPSPQKPSLSFCPLFLPLPSITYLHFLFFYSNLSWAFLSCPFCSSSIIPPICFVLFPPFYPLVLLFSPSLPLVSLFSLLQPFLGSSDSVNQISGKIKLGKEVLATLEGHWVRHILCWLLVHYSGNKPE